MSQNADKRDFELDFSDPDLKFLRRADVLSADLDGEIAILDPQSKTYFGVKDVSALIWRELQSPQSVSSLVEAVRQAYDVSEQQCEIDVVDFSKVLADRGLLTVC